MTELYKFLGPWENELITPSRCQGLRFWRASQRMHFHIGLPSHTSTEENILALVKSTSTHYFSQFSF